MLVQDQFEVGTVTAAPVLLDPSAVRMIVCPASTVGFDGETVSVVTPGAVGVVVPGGVVVPAPRGGCLIGGLLLLFPPPPEPPPQPVNPRHRTREENAHKDPIFFI